LSKQVQWFQRKCPSVSQAEAPLRWCVSSDNGYLLELFYMQL